MLYNKNILLGPIAKFIPNEMLRSIASKFNPDSESSLSKIIFGGRSDLKFNDAFLQKYPDSKKDRLSFIQLKRPTILQLGKNEEYELKSSTFEALPYVFSSEPDGDLADNYHLLGLVNGRREWKYIKRCYMTPRYEVNNINSYKVFTPKANGSGLLGEQLSKTEIGYPGDSATSTFISIGSFETLEEAQNCSKYLKTRFLRCLLGILKITQDNPPSVWAYIPIQNFTANSDIDWTQTVANIDRQLYKKYGLTAEEIAFIESMIKPMK